MSTNTRGSDAYYFPHDYNARRDPKLIKLVSEYGPAAGWYYWCTVEYLREQSGYTFNEADVSHFALIGLHNPDIEYARSLLAALVKLGLLELEGGVYSCPALSDRMAPWDARREHLREIGKRGGQRSKRGKSKPKDDKRTVKRTVKPPPGVPDIEPEPETRVNGTTPLGKKVEEILSKYDDGGGQGEK